jgi:sigma-B regulation protein RsbU (phosphoserine phosphatase)
MSYQFDSGTEIDLSLQRWGFILLLFILMVELKDKLLARDELETGRKVQLSLLPKGQPEIAGWDVRFYTRPANDVGGDLVDYLGVANGKTGLALGDVSGKGLGAALLMAKLQATLRAVATDFSSLADLGKRMNDIFIRDQVADKYSTLVYMEIGPGSGSVRLLNAGHLPPVIVRPRTIDETPPVAPPIGMLADSTYVEQQLELEAGDTMIVYSDGVTEALDEAGEFYGDDRLMKLLERTRGLMAGDAARLILDDVDRFVGEERPSDDLSLVILRRK